MHVLAASRPAIGRRLLLGGTAAALGALGGLSGCSLRGSGANTSTPSGTITPPTAPPVDADQRVVDEAVRHLSRVHALVRATLATSPSLRSDLEPLLRLHATHAARLGGLVHESPPHIPRSGTARSVVAAAEVDLQHQLTSCCLRAHSGALAATLASMAAAVAQHLAAR